MPGKVSERFGRTAPPSGAVGDPKPVVATSGHGNLSIMGLNPFRDGSKPRSMADYAMVAGAFVVTIAAIIWGFFG